MMWSCPEGFAMELLHWKKNCSCMPTSSLLYMQGACVDLCSVKFCVLVQTTDVASVDDGRYCEEGKDG